jgi:UDP-2,4-diacetamido-2,4,6-trideoxy-beta-L-altropyranose hydrolase
MRVALRADASRFIGSGHVMRCLTLADELVAQGHTTHFVVRELPGHLAELIRQRGHDCTLLPLAKKDDAVSPHSPWLAVPSAQDADETERALQAAGGCELLVVDHYGIDAGWEGRVRRPGRRILSIDDLADRPHSCDFLLDQNLQEHEGRYDGLLPTGCRTFLGPSYALLRPQFTAARKSLPPREGRVQRVFISLGGSDLEDVTTMALSAFVQLGEDRQIGRSDLQADVVIGASNPRHAEVAALCARLPGVTSHYNVAEMAPLMAAADLAIGAAGVTTWERACLGLPAIVVTVAENQRSLARCAERIGILTWLGDVTAETPTQLLQALRAALAAPERLTAQSLRGRELVDGCGAARVVRAILP